MTPKSEALLREVLGLSDDERAELAVGILDSLDDRATESDPDELAGVWAEEIERRARQVVSGAVQTEDWETVLERVDRDRRMR